MTLFQQARRAGEIEQLGGQRRLTRKEVDEYNTLAMLSWARHLRARGRVH